MKETSVCAAARKEIDKEKDRILRKKKRIPSPLEQAALAWKKKKEEEKRRAEQEKRVQREQQTPMISVQKIPAQAKVLNNRTDDAMQWKQYRWREEEKEMKRLRLNEATIRGLGKRLIAKEWARALGRKTEDTRVLALEQEATEYRKRKEEEKRRAEQEKERAEKQKEMLRNSLGTFGKKFLEVKGSVTQEMAAKLFEGALESVGEIIEVNWTEDGCEAHIEPWEEKKLRKKRQVSSPVIYKVNIDKMLKIVSYERINQGGTGQRTDGRRQKTEDRKQRADGRRQKTEDRKQRAEGRRK